MTWGKCNYKAKKRRSCRRRRSCWRSRQQYLSQYRERWCCWTRSCVRETRTGVTRRWRGRWSKGCPRQSYIGAIEPRYNLRPNGARAGSWKGRSYGLHLIIKRGINKLGAAGTKAIIKELSQIVDRNVFHQAIRQFSRIMNVPKTVFWCICGCLI